LGFFFVFGLRGESEAGRVAISVTLTGVYIYFVAGDVVLLWGFCLSVEMSLMLESFLRGEGFCEGVVVSRWWQGDPCLGLCACWHEGEMTFILLSEM
jgi:hypothetical protein